MYGPYKYHSRKIRGKVITEYLGKAEEKNKNKLFLILFIVGLISLFSLIFILSYNSNFVKTMTGFIVSDDFEDETASAVIRFVIEITKAKHLDTSRNFISNIYDEVKALDDVWSEEIPSGDYVRVTFEENLTSENDITIYPRVVSGSPTIEVYEIDGTEIIVQFSDIISNEYNKVLLINLQGTQDTFDLRIVDGSLEFEHIFDPEKSLYTENLGDESEELEKGQESKKILIKEVKE